MHVRPTVIISHYVQVLNHNSAHIKLIYTNAACLLYKKKRSIHVRVQAHIYSSIPVNANGFA